MCSFAISSFKLSSPSIQYVKWAVEHFMAGPKELAATLVLISKYARTTVPSWNSSKFGRCDRKSWHPMSINITLSGEQALKLYYVIGNMQTSKIACASYIPFRAPRTTFPFTFLVFIASVGRLGLNYSLRKPPIHSLKFFPPHFESSIPRASRTALTDNSIEPAFVLLTLN